MSQAKQIGLLVGLTIGGGVLLLVVWFFLSIPSSPKPPSDLTVRVSTASDVDLPEVRKELLRMKWVDQKIRQDFADSLKAGGFDGVSGLFGALRYSLLEGRVDENNTARLKELVAEHGWLHEGHVGEEGAEAAFLIAQHADHDPVFQKAVLASVREAYQNGYASGQQVALLTDRVRIAQGKLQRYGTQAQIQNGRLRVYSIEDSTGVDDRRSELGLPPLADYMERMKEEYRQ